MSRTLPVLATLGAILAAFGTVSSGPALVVVPILAIIAGVLMLFEREGKPVLVGSILAVLGILGILSVTPVNTERLDLTALNDNLGEPFVASVGLLVVGAALVLLWDQVQPTWLRIGGAVLVALTIAAFFAVDDAAFGNLSNLGVSIPLLLLALLCAAPMVRVAWALSPPPAPPTGPPSE